MSERFDLLLAPSDLWRRHGPLNLIATLGSPLAGLASAVVLATTETFSTTSVFVLALLLAAPLTNRQVLRSIVAVVSMRPYLTVSGSGLHLDGCVFDSVDLAWSDIEAMSPYPASVRAALQSGSFLVITLRVRTGRTTPWTFSSVQHPVYRDHFEITGYFRRPPDGVVDAVVNCFATNVKRHEPFLLSDMAD
jgi:hypothetical protein